MLAARSLSRSISRNTQRGSVVESFVLTNLGLPGVIYHGSYEVARPFYDDARLYTKKIIIINVSRHKGPAVIDTYIFNNFEKKPELENKCFWFPMTHDECKQESPKYLQLHGQEILQHLRAGFACMVHDNDGRPGRAEAMARALLKYCERNNTYDTDTNPEDTSSALRTSSQMV